MTLVLIVVDAFTSTRFHGNPAAVAQLESFADDELLQAVAAEMQLSETAFVVGRPDGDHDLRWFTPRTEVSLCGHATLAAAHVLGGQRRFHTPSGVLSCTSVAGWIEMKLPTDDPQEAPMPTGLPAALGLDPADVRSFHSAREDALVELRDAGAVRQTTPDLQFLARLGTRAVIVTAPSDRRDRHFVSRVFAPNVGIAEDPVTGSAHCSLAAFWGGRLSLDEMVAEQASSRRGAVRVRVGGDHVVVSGQAVTVSRVEMTLPTRKRAVRQAPGQR